MSARIGSWSPVLLHRSTTRQYGSSQYFALPFLVLTGLRTIPLTIVSVDADGNRTVDKGIVLDEREKFIALDTSKPFKLNGGTIGVCE